MQADVRRAGPADAAEIARIVNGASMRLHGTAELSDDEIAHWFGDTTVEAWLGPESYCDLQHAEGRTRFWIDLRGEPSPELLAAAEGRARKLAAPGAVLRSFADAEDGPLRELLEGEGFVPVRSSFRMRRELDSAPAPASWPAGLAGRAASPDDARRAYDAYVESFADHWDFHPEPYEEFVHWHVAAASADLSLWLVVEDGDELAGVLIGRPHPSGDPATGWISILGVRRPWRGRGLALALLEQSFATFHCRACRAVELGVDAENATGAVRLYERAGMRVARRSDTLEKRLA